MDFTPVATRPDRKADMGKITQFLVGACGVIFIVAFVLFGVLFELAVDEQLEDRAYVCDKNSDFYDSWRNTKKAGAQLRRSFYFYNITNPTEALNGGSFQLTEVGPFTFDFTNQKFDIEFKSGGTVHFREYQRLTFSEKHSCDTCTETTPINTMNIAWQAVLLDSQSEGLLSLLTVCTFNQVILMRSTDPIPFCTSEQRNKPDENCKCCNPQLGECSTIVDPTTTASTALVSFMAKFDSGAVVSDASPDGYGVPFLDAIYSPSIITSSPRGIIGGRASALFGFIQARTNLDDMAVLKPVADFTNEYYDACKSYCPDLTAFGALAPEQKVGFIMQARCEGYITEEDTDKNYLVGMSCLQATPTHLGQVMAETYTCANGDDTAPCCMVANTMPLLGNANMPGWGCVRELPGYLLTRKTDSQEEYAATNTWGFEQKTGCKGSGKSNALDMVEFKSKKKYTVWYTPEDYDFDQNNMPYADTVYPKQVKEGVPDLDGTTASFDVTGKDVGMREPKGFSTDFFEYQGTDGKLSGVKMDIFSRTLQQPIEFTYHGTSKVKDINVAEFKMDYQALTARTEENQRKGFGVPYAGIYAGLQYALSVPAFVSFPHFYQGDEAAKTQSDNTALFTPSTSGIELTSRVSSYWKAGPLLEVPVPIDEAYSKDNAGLYDISLYLDPWSGKSLSSTVVLMISTTVWRCSPQVDQGGCGPFLRINPSDLLCYRNPATPTVSFPCSAANVFSPKMLGGKIIPNFFVTEKSEIDDDTADTFHEAFTTRQASHIMLVVGVVLGGLMIIGAVWSASTSTKNADTKQNEKRGAAIREHEQGTGAVPGRMEMEGNDAL